jgi:hypothetical protein
VLIGRPRRFDDVAIHALEDDGWRPDHRVMRSGKTEDAMCAAGMIGIAGRQVRCGLAVMKTKLESRHVLVGLRRQREAAKHDQQALRGDGVGNDQADQGPPEPLGLHGKFEHAAAHNHNLILRTVKPKSQRHIECGFIDCGGLWRRRNITSAACA